MKSSVIHPNELLEAILSKGVRSDKADKLRKLNDLCSLEYSRHTQGARDLSLSNMSKLAELNGLFKARTIYNSQSRDYVNLVEAWNEYNGPKQSKILKAEFGSSEKYGFLEKIDDGAVRSLCHIAFAERDKLKNELDLLKSRTQLIVDMRPLGADMHKQLGNVAIIEPIARLTDSEKRALVEAISADFFRYRNWRLGDTGEILDDRNRFVFLPGFVTAINKILGQHKETD